MQTTDPQDEIFPMVDENDNVIGKVSRKEANSNPNIIHRSVFIFVYNSDGKILLQQRSLTKDTGPGLWTVSICGHVDYGSEYLATAIREAEEELGIQVKAEELKELGKYLVHLERETEFMMTYKYKANDNCKFTFPEKEIQKIEYFTLDEIKALIEQGEVTWNAVKLIQTLLNDQKL